MRPRHSLGLSTVTFGFWLFLLLPFFHAQTADDLFDFYTVQDLRLQMNSRDLRQLRATYRENTYYPADLTWRNLRVRNVGVRSRGFDSRDPSKLGLLINVNRYTPGQAFLGLRSIALDNFRRDPSMMREPLAMALFRRMGQTAPRESFTRLYINNDYQGLYAVIEDIDRPYLARTFGRDDGYLFEYRWLQPFYGDYPGDDVGVYKTLFEPRTHESWPDETLYGPIRSLFSTFNLPEGVTGRDDLEQCLDLQQFVTLLGIEDLLGDEDGFIGANGMNNFYLYRDLNTSRHSILIWDRDRAFNFMRESVLDRIDQNALTRRALSYDDLFDLYLRVLESSAHVALDGDWLAVEIDRIQTMIGPAANSDARKPFSNQEFEDGVAFLREWATVRPALVLEEVAAIRAARR